MILHLNYLLAQELIFLRFLDNILTDSHKCFILRLDLIPQFHDFFSLPFYRALLLVDQALVL